MQSSKRPSLTQFPLSFFTFQYFHNAPLRFFFLFCFHPPQFCYLFLPSFQPSFIHLSFLSFTHQSYPCRHFPPSPLFLIIPPLTSISLSIFPTSLVSPFPPLTPLLSSFFLSLYSTLSPIVSVSLDFCTAPQYFHLHSAFLPRFFLFYFLLSFLSPINPTNVALSLPLLPFSFSLLSHPSACLFSQPL